MKSPAQNEFTTQPVIDPAEDEVYSLEVLAELAGVSSLTVLHYHEQGLLAGGASDDSEGLSFNDEALRQLRRIEHLRTVCEINEAALRMVLGLVEEVEFLREDLRRRR